MIAHALETVDRVANEMENKWGIGRLTTLIPADLAAKFGKAKAQLDQAIDDNNPELVAVYADALARGWQALDQKALAMGHKLIGSETVSVVTEAGRKFAFAADVPTADAANKLLAGDVTCMAWIEAARIIEAYDKDNIIGAVKQTWPEATIAAVNQAKRDDPFDLDDEIPF